jgi:hypothetical protein
MSIFNLTSSLCHLLLLLPLPLAADDDKCETLFCRSGLRDTASRGFDELPVYRAFDALLQVRATGCQLSPLSTV